MKYAPIIVVIYMLSALCWWTFLLYKKNEVIYTQQKAISIMSDLEADSNIADIESEYNRQNIMIIGEGVVFGLALIVGVSYLWLVYKKDIRNTERQNNFLLSITHELKSPLASIKLAFETIKKRELNRNQNKVISINGITEVDRLHKQLENILDATAIEQKYYVDLLQTNLVSLLNDIKEDRRNAIDEHRVIYILNETSDNKSSFEIDMNAVNKICKNLIENALKYSDNEVVFTLSKEANNVIIKVKDTGPGIPEDEKGNIFKRFYRLGNEETRSSTGTGLGLFIVNQLVKKNNGSVNISKNSPQGSIFTVRLNVK